MPDVVDQQTRSRMMSGIRDRNTKPELQVRQGLFALGYRYRLHASALPGKPDLVLPKYRAAIFVNGCFWHQHGCHLFKMPATRRNFWEAKIARNVERDAQARRALLGIDWRSLVIWECALKGRTRLDFDELISRVSAWIRGSDQLGEISGGA